MPDNTRIGEGARGFQHDHLGATTTHDGGLTITIRSWTGHGMALSVDRQQGEDFLREVADALNRAPEEDRWLAFSTDEIDAMAETLPDSLPGVMDEWRRRHGYSRAL